MNEDIANLGPLAVLAGEWEGNKGADKAPSEPERDVALSDYREHMRFVPIGRVDNHEQILYGLRYATTAWRIGADQSFHEEVGYWLWDAERKEVMRCFVVPRGITSIATGTAEADARAFTLESTLGSPTNGICANAFLDREFKTERYEFSLEVLSDDSFRYEQDTVLRIRGQNTAFHHTDANVMRRIAGAG